MIQILRSKKEEVHSAQPTNSLKFIAAARRLMLSWEIYLILFVSAFFRFININNAIFNDDEVNVFRLAHDAVVSGWLPLTSNRASLGILNPPMVVYFFMLPASLSANPLWGQVMVALFNTAAILLTYFFVRRYYGRLAGTIAALLYATSAGAWTFSRNIWPQNFLPFFVMLFLFMLFRGVVERRKGWLFWAIVLFGVLYQFHGSTLYLLIPLAAAVLLAFRTIRWRDIILGAVALLVLFAPYIIWEFHAHFIDIAMLFDTQKQPAQTDAEALHLYLFFLHPTLVNPYLDAGARIRDTHLLLPDGQSILAQSHLLILLKLSYLLAILLFLGGVFITIAQVISIYTASLAEPKKNIFARWWTEFRANPSRQGLALLLLWQIAPLILLTHHSIVLFVHYFIFLLPGQFILMALCIVQTIALVKRFRPSWERIARYSFSALAILVILAQLIGISSTVIDISAGHFQNAVFSDLSDQQRALQLADQVAQQRHIHRMYLTAYPSYVKMDSMAYLAEQTNIPFEFFALDDCFILPSPAAGPVIFLTTAGNALADTLFAQYANATLVATSPHAGSAPYQIYVLTAKPEPAPVPHAYNQSLQLLSPEAQLLQNTQANTQWLTTRWSILNAHNPALRTAYGFNFQMRSVAGASLNDNLSCTPTSTWAGDQLFVFHTASKGSPIPSRISLQVSTFTSQPQTLALGPITGLIYNNTNTASQTLLTDEGKKNMIVDCYANH